jgi:hypothetical protein
VKKDFGDYKNALPDEVDDRPPADVLHQLHTQADDERPLTRREAEVAGLTLEDGPVYGESSDNETNDEHRDANRVGPGEHV